MFVSLSFQFFLIFIFLVSPLAQPCSRGVVPIVDGPKNTSIFSPLIAFMNCLHVFMVHGTQRTATFKVTRYDIF